VDGTSDIAVFAGDRKDYSVEVITYDTKTSDGVITAYKITDKGGLNADGLNLENLIYTGANAFTGTGNSQDNVITGGGGNDVLNGGGGNDTLIGGAGRDNLTGSTGLDTFVFRSAAEAGNGTGNNASNADLITDFLVGTDKIDLSLIDANTQVALDQAFIWDNTLETGNTRPTAGHLGYHYEGSGANAVTVIDGNINTSRFGNDTTVDFQIKLAGTLVLHASDFIL